MDLAFLAPGLTLESLFTLKNILFLLFILFSNPLVPDWGLQLLVALVIGWLLPEMIVIPLDNLITRIPGVGKFKSYLENHRWVKKLRESGQRRVQQIIPRIIAGYLFTYIIGWSSLLLYTILP